MIPRIHPATQSTGFLPKLPNTPTPHTPHPHSVTVIPDSYLHPKLEPPIDVLVIEDNLAEARLLEEVLKGALLSQFSLSHVKRLGEAIGQLPEKHFDVALLDLSLPDSLGLDSLDSLIAHAPNLSTDAKIFIHLSNEEPRFCKGFRRCE